jgi:hypothetical protein
MQEYKWTFAPYAGGKGRGTCPSCGRKNSFSYYIDTDTGELLSEDYGRCNREENCGHHYSPYHNPPDTNTGVVIPYKIRIDDGSYNTIPVEVYKKSFKRKYTDNLFNFLCEVFPQEKVRRVFKLYRVGVSTKFYGNSTVFWQIDRDLKLRSGKIIQYGRDGKRVKGDYPMVSWVHSKFKGDFKLRQCFYGEHLLKVFPEKEVRVVESEKTCLIMTCFSDKHIWLSAGSMQGLSDSKMEVLKGRDVTFIPDKGKAYHVWRKRISDFSEEKWTISDFMENTNMERGEDVADFILENLKKV